MRSSPLALLALAVAACGGPHGGSPDAAATDGAPPDAVAVPAFRNPVDLPDDQLALRALQILGAPVDGADTRCEVCHGMTRSRLHVWDSLSSTAMSDCLYDLNISDSAQARAMIACMRLDPLDDTSVFTPAHLGIYATGVDLPWFDALFEIAYPGEGDVKQQALISRALMPRNMAPLDQGQFDILAEWAARGMPHVDDMVPPDPVGDCTPDIGPEVAAHVTAMQTGGWTAVNASAGIDMLGCAGATTPRDCLGGYPDATTTGYGAIWGQDLPGATLRVLASLPYATSYWTRSSADGRFVAHGGGTSASSTIVDLANPGRYIGTTGAYDPGFFPDNSGFVFQGGGATLCDQRVLSATPFDNYIDYTESGCTAATTQTLYQHMGATPGGDHWMINSEWVGDGGWPGAQGDPAPWFDSGGYVTLMPVVYDGTSFTQRPFTTVTTPYEGDAVLTPAGGMVVTRVNSGGNQSGYRMRQVNATWNGSSYDVTLPVVATYCVKGAKPAFSFDERWMVLHHYITDADATDLGFTGPTDPGWAPYHAQGSADVYLVDVLTGTETRITRMGPGQFALYPHFRSDGWIYFIVKGPEGEHVVASDAALFLTGG